MVHLHNIGESVSDLTLMISGHCSPIVVATVNDN